MRISDWSSDVCSADLATAGAMSPGAWMRHSARRSRDAVRTPAAGWPGCRARDVCPTTAIANREEGHEGSPDIIAACGCARDGAWRLYACTRGPARGALGHRDR